MRKIITFTPLLVIAVINSANAVAAPATLPLTVMPALGATSWEVTNTGGTTLGTAFTGACDDTAGFAINDATSASGDIDAYDYAYSIWVNGVIFEAPDPVDLTGNTVTAGPMVMSGLNVSVEYSFSDMVQAGRIRAIFQNPTGNPVNISVDIPVNLGSGGATVIEATSSGDAVFNAADRWVVTSDGVPAGDPANTTVLWGAGAAVMPSSVTTTVFGCGGTEGVGATFDITIPANSTRQLMLFAGLGDVTGMGNTVAGAVANATMFDDNDTIDPSLLAGIPDGDLGDIINWAFRVGKGGSSCSLGPTITSARQAGDLWLLLAGLLALGLWRARRRIDQ